jgi:hypothetical protein
MRHRSIAPLSAALLLLVLLAACSGNDDTAEPSATTGDTSSSTSAPTTTQAAAAANPYGDYQSANYADGQNWLCRPDQDDICDTSLDATVVHPDGTVEVEHTEAAADPPVDCFYVYPTISADPGPLADFEPAEAQEGNAAFNQASRFSSLCRVYAPVYRQITLAGLGGGASEQDRETAYGDVLDAWKEYISHDNDGRGVVLIGHSQGAGHLERLIAEEIDGQPLQDRIVSALLLGAAVPVPAGEVVGGAFEDVPICTAEGEVGCVVAYSTFRATDPPGADSYFGRVDGPERAACVNPAALGGGSAPLTPYFPADGAQPFSPSATDVPEITTPWVTYPDFLTGECRRDDDLDVDWLELTIAADPADPRTDDIPGDLTPPWGLHLVDANIAMGDLVDLVATQVDSYTG